MTLIRPLNKGQGHSFWYQGAIQTICHAWRGGSPGRGQVRCDKVWQGRGGSSAMCDVMLVKYFYNTFIVISNLLGLDCQRDLSWPHFASCWICCNGLHSEYCLNVWNAYDDEWMHLCIYLGLFMCRWITFGWLGNYGAEVSKMHTVGWGYCSLWHISDRGV